MIFNVYFPAPTGSVFDQDSFERVRGSVVYLSMADQKIPAKVLNIDVNDGAGASFTFEVDAEFHHRVGPKLEDLLSIHFKSEDIG